MDGCSGTVINEAPTKDAVQDETCPHPLCQIHSGSRRTEIHVNDVPQGRPRDLLQEPRRIREVYLKRSDCINAQHRHLERRRCPFGVGKQNINLTSRARRRAPEPSDSTSCRARFPVVFSHGGSDMAKSLNIPYLELVLDAVMSKVLSDDRARQRAGQRITCGHLHGRLSRGHLIKRMSCRAHAPKPYFEQASPKSRLFDDGDGLQRAGPHCEKP